MFKPYCLAYTEYGPRAFPVQAFEAFKTQLAPCSWAAQVLSPLDEEIFLQFFPRYAWLIKSANRRGYGAPNVHQKCS